MKKIFIVMFVFCFVNISALESCAEIIDFEAIASGTIVSEVYGDSGTGPIGVRGTNTELDTLFSGPNNAAVIFDSSNPPSYDLDIGTPNQDFGGPGEGTGGESGSPYENKVSLKHILIINEARDFVDRNPDGKIDGSDSPVIKTDDSFRKDGSIMFDFSGVGPVIVRSINIVDVEAEESSATVELFDGSNNTLAFFTLPQTGDNGMTVTDLGPTSGVIKMKVLLYGSGGIDNIVFDLPVCGNDILDPGEECDGDADNACPGECRDDCTCPEGGAEGCTPGYWKQEQHFGSWTSPYIPEGNNATTFFDAFECSIPIRVKRPGKGKPTENTGPITLLDALKAKGGGCSALARHAVAALLNAAGSGVNYGTNVEEIKDEVCDAIKKDECESLKNTLAEQNERGCPLGLTPPPLDDALLLSADTDQDGVIDDEDNCPETANGPDAGTCVATENIKINGKACSIIDQSCGCQGFCSMDQEDSDGNGTGDVCDSK